MNQVTLLGRLGKDPEVAYTQGGTAVCKFSLATSEKYKDRNGEQKEKTEWHNIVIWGKSGENAAKYLAKGNIVLIERGKITTRSWDDEKTGRKAYMTEIVVERYSLLPQGRGDARQTGEDRGSGGGRQGQQQGQQQGFFEGGSGGGATHPDDDDIPF
jgi:single-strand DNA-binding protein